MTICGVLIRQRSPYLNIMDEIVDVLDMCFSKNVRHRNAFHRFHPVLYSRPIKRSEVPRWFAIIVNSAVKGLHKGLTHEFYDAPHVVGLGIVYTARNLAKKSGVGNIFKFWI
jgi:hypothetical protein